MQKIRIGSDIRLMVTLSGVKFGGDEYALVNIQSMTAILQNTTLKNKYKEKLKDKTRFISRYPIEPHLDEFVATTANLNTSGYPAYHVMPNSHMIRTYAGYGVEPEFDIIYRKMHKYNLTDYRTPVEHTSAPDTVYVYFPAEAQLFPGVYKLIIVAQIYVPGYNKNNLRTITVDHEEVFELVTSSSEEETEGEITIVIDEGSSVVYDNFVEFTDYDNAGTVELHMTNGDTVPIDLTSEFTWGEFD